MTGLSVCPENFASVEGKAIAIHLDILAGNFDPTLEKYKLAKPHLEVVTPIKKPISLLEIYDLYCESRKRTIEQTTLELEFRGKFRRAITEAIEVVGNDAL